MRACTFCVAKTLILTVDKRAANISLLYVSEDNHGQYYSQRT